MAGQSDCLRLEGSSPICDALGGLRNPHAVSHIVPRPACGYGKNVGARIELLA